MSPPPLRALLARGAGGLPPPMPIDFARGGPVLPPTPNAHLAAPPGYEGPKHRTVPPFPVAPEVAWEAVRRLGHDFPRTWRLAAWPERRQAQWVARTAVLNFPDIVVAQVVPAPGGAAGLFLLSRSLFGRYDFGANRRRVDAWLAALDAALRPAA